MIGHFTEISDCRLQISLEICLRQLDVVTVAQHNLQLQSAICNLQLQSEI